MTEIRQPLFPKRSSSSCSSNTRELLKPKLSPCSSSCRLLVGTSGDTTRAAGGNETNLSTRRSIAFGSGCFTNVLVVTTTVRVLDGVHRHTSHLRPTVSLCFVFMVRAACFEHRLIETSTATDNAYHSTATALADFLGSGGKANARRSLIKVVCYDRSVVSGCSSQFTTVALLLFNVADDGTLRHSRKRKNVSDLKLCLSTCEDELTCVDPLGSNEVHFVELVFVRVAEDHASDGSSSTRVMNDFTDNTLNVSMTLCEVKSTVLYSSFTVLRVGLEDGPTTLTLTANLLTHDGGSGN
mmetsp:Transcript_38450/g.62498  ORF Transcript_38450/g.62498 Transcript_38450/m.62498 type:complete len:297 (+) Transcript_38450:59-949(+)